MHEGPLCIHKIEFMVQSSPSFRDCRRIADHTHGTRDFGDVRSGNSRRRLIVDTNLYVLRPNFIQKRARCYKMQGSLNHVIRLKPTLNPVGHQSTNWMDRLVLMEAMAALTSFGTTSPRYSMQHAMYFPWRGSHLTIWLVGSKHAWFERKQVQ